MEILKKFTPYLFSVSSFKLRFYIVLSIICLLLGKVLFIYAPFLLKDIVNQINQNISLAEATVVFSVFAYGFVRFSNSLFEQFRDLLFMRVGQNAIRLLSLDVFKHLLNLPMSFHEDRNTGVLIKSLDRGIMASEVIFKYILFDILPSILEISLIFLALWKVLNIGYATVIIIMVLIYLIFTYFVAQKRDKLLTEVTDYEDELAERAFDTLTNIETIKLFNTSFLENNRYNDSLKKYEIAAIKCQNSLSFLTVGQSFILTAGLIVNMIYCVFQIQKNILSLGDLVLIHTFLLQLYIPLGALSSTYKQIKQSIVDMKKMMDLLKLPQEIVSSENYFKNKNGFKGNVEFLNIDFSYKGKRKKALEQVSFAIETGKMVAIVGPSGSGKSTISKLLFQVYKPTKGKILIDDHDIFLSDSKNLSNLMAIVPQDVGLFNETLLYNVTYGIEKVSLEEIYRILALCNLNELIDSMPQGLHTIVGEKGIKLSGGEKQRIGIARALLRKPRILILDEATSSLDSSNEKQILKKIENEFRNMTKLVIAHRLSTIVNADKIIVLSNGKIEEFGTHDKLLKEGKTYAALWKKQHEKLHVK